MAVDMNQAIGPIIAASVAKDKISSGEKTTFNILNKARQAQAKAANALQEALNEKGNQQIKANLDRKYGRGAYKYISDFITNDKYHDYLLRGLTDPNGKEMFSGLDMPEDFNGHKTIDIYHDFQAQKYNLFRNRNSIINEYATSIMDVGDYVPESSFVDKMDVENKENYELADPEQLYRHAAAGEVKASKLQKYAKKAEKYDNKLDAIDTKIRWDNM